MSKYKLNPCPFCGGEAIVEIFEFNGNRFVRCLDCYATSGQATDIKNAIEAWNKRVDTSLCATCDLFKDCAPIGSRWECDNYEKKDGG